MIMTRSNGKKSREWAIQYVHIEDPPIDSPAHLVMLAKMYSRQDKTIYTEWRMTRIRRSWMKKQMKTPDALGGLTCAKCGRQGLLPWTEDIHQRATLDHITEIFRGGPWRDPNNFQVLCDRCNNTKNAVNNTRP